jgi:hypothetical protein
VHLFLLPLLPHTFDHPWVCSLVQKLDSFSLWFLYKFFKCLTTNKQAIHEPSTSASGHLTSENISATASATSTTEEWNISVWSVTPGEFSSQKKRQYQEKYLEHKFIYFTTNGEQQSQCLICSEILATDSTQPAKLKRRTATKNAEFKNKPIEFLQRKLKSLSQQKVDKRTHNSTNKDTQSITWGITLNHKNKKPHTMSESIIMPEAIKITDILHWKQHANQLKFMPLANNSCYVNKGNLWWHLQFNLMNQPTLPI